MSVNRNQKSLSGNQEKNPEKRCARRIPADVNIVFTRFVTRNEAKFFAKTFDYSTEGMAFESKYPLRKGDSLFIRAESPCPSRGECLRTATLAEVKWCREVPRKFASNFRTGVKYY